MSVLIKGMEMPEACSLCDLTIWDSNAGEDRCFFTGNYTSTNYGLFYGDCPLVPVSPHGRLIDADKLLDEGADLCVCGENREIWGFSYDMINNAPTVIKAEEENGE